MVTRMKKHIPRSLVLSLSLAGALWAAAQVTIQSATLNGELFTPTTLYQLVVMNNGPATSVRIEGAILTKQGEQVASFRSNEHLLSTGVATLSATAIPMATFTYGTGDMGRNARVHQRLAGGNYKWCVRISSAALETNDEWCDVLEMQDLIYLDLVMPWNGDSIHEVRPALTWTMSGTPAATAAAQVRITVVPQPARMNAAQALAAEVPIFNLSNVTQRTLPYPTGAPDLERGKCYAWQAERLIEGRVADRSDPWSFCVRDIPRPMADKYVLLDRVEPGSIYQAIDERIYFRYDEPYSTSTLTCVILGPDRHQLEPIARNDNAEEALTSTKRAGVNLYELDLSTYALKAGTYTLRVFDGKGRQHELQFNVPR